MKSILATFLCAAALWAADIPRHAPGFALVDAKFHLVDLYDYHGKPVVIEFMQTTCPHCAAFTSVLAQVQQKFGDRVGIVSIANPPDNQTTVGQFIAGHNISYPVLFDCGQVAYSYIQAQRFDLPEVFLIDANGVIQRHFEYGPMTRNVFEGTALLTEIERLLPAPRKK